MLTTDTIHKKLCGSTHKELRCKTHYRPKNQSPDPHTVWKFSVSGVFLAHQCMVENLRTQIIFLAIQHAKWFKASTPSAILCLLFWQAQYSSTYWAWRKECKLCSNYSLVTVHVSWLSPCQLSCDIDQTQKQLACIQVWLLYTTRQWVLWPHLGKGIQDNLLSGSFLPLAALWRQRKQNKYRKESEKTGKQGTLRSQITGNQETKETWRYRTSCALFKRDSGRAYCRLLQRVDFKFNQ